MRWLRRRWAKMVCTLVGHNWVVLPDSDHAWATHCTRCHI